MLQEQGTFHSCRVTDRQTGKDIGRKGPREHPAGGRERPCAVERASVLLDRIVPCQAARQHFQALGPWLPLKQG